MSSSIGTEYKYDVHVSSRQARAGIGTPNPGSPDDDSMSRDRSALEDTKILVWTRNIQYKD
jgi:hypothetical protein